MKIKYLDNDVASQSNFFHIRQQSGECLIDRISTDNSEKLGNEPVLITDKETIAMDYDGKRYTAKIKYQTEKYRIFYKDTGKFENQGKPIELNKHKISKDIFINELKKLGKPLQKDISKGCAQGKIVNDINNIPKNEAVILILGDVGVGYNLVSLPQNVQGVVVSDGNINHLSHIASLSRNYFNLFTILYDEDRYNELMKMNGKYVDISNFDGNLSYKEIEKPDFIIDKNYIEIPKISDNEKFLNYSQIDKSNAGPKAYKIALMQKLKYDGVLNDINIPRGFIIPNGYIDKVEEFLNDAKTKNERNNRMFENPFIFELEQKCDGMGIEPEKTIMRSAFNAEDLYEYPTAGLYCSERCYDKYDFVITIDDIVASKDSPQAIESRKRYNIPNNAIQTSIILQEYIPSDFKFTAYTDGCNKKVIIELGAQKYAHISLEPAKIVYDKNKQESIIIKHQVYDSKFITDDKGNILEKEDGQNLILDNWEELAPIIEIIGNNALTLENIMHKPQDIEGGIIGNKVYFWQTRDITKKAQERL